MREIDLTQVVLVNISEIKPYHLNTKQHPEAQVNRIANSIATYGFDQPIVVDENNVIIKGHGRYFAAKKLELGEVPVYKQTGMSKEDIMASRIADNRVAESEWDTKVLWDEMSDLKKTDNMGLDDFGFSHHSVKSMFKEQDLSLLVLRKLPVNRSMINTMIIKTSVMPRMMTLQTLPTFKLKVL